MLRQFRQRMAEKGALAHPRNNDILLLRFCRARKFQLEKVEEIRLGDNEISDVGAIAIADAIRASAPPELKELSLHSNCIDRAGCEALKRLAAETTCRVSPDDLLDSQK